MKFLVGIHASVQFGFQINNGNKATEIYYKFDRFQKKFNL